MPETVPRRAQSLQISQLPLHTRDGFSQQPVDPHEQELMVRPRHPQLQKEPSLPESENPPGSDTVGSEIPLLPRSCEHFEETLPTQQPLARHSPPTVHSINSSGVTSVMDTWQMCSASAATTVLCPNELTATPLGLPMTADAPARAAAPSVAIADTTVTPFVYAHGGALATSTSSALSVSLNTHSQLQSRPDLMDARFHRSTPKTPPRKKCEQCEALNPTARQARDALADPHASYPLVAPFSTRCTCSAPRVHADLTRTVLHLMWCSVQHEAEEQR